jgi:hypothetical protein
MFLALLRGFYISVIYIDKQIIVRNQGKNRLEGFIFTRKLIA